MTKRTLPLALAVVIVSAVVAAWYLASPLIKERTVDERLPFAIPDSEKLADMSLQELEKLQTQLLATAADMPDRIMNDSMPTSPRELQPVLVAQGEFQGADSIHKGSGSAIVYELPDGSRLLRL
ncbi:MAG: hypothetical protein L0Z68_06570, partial [Gammaproteobacteria bacterium]|nr:hypothetical protein [Gammaproteobacteria bacterium]